MPFHAHSHPNQAQTISHTLTPSSTQHVTVPEGFTLSMALWDAVPVLFFCASSVVIAANFESILFRLGAALCIAAGLGKVLWKLWIALFHKNVWVLNRQLRVLMPSGFALIVLSVVQKHATLPLAAITRAAVRPPVIVFLVAGCLGMVLMTVFARRLNGTDARANWLEQLVNGLAQGAFFVAVLLLTKGG